jgi:Flp pilus assembly pilin Flp
MVKCLLSFSLRCVPDWRPSRSSAEDPKEAMVALELAAGVHAWWRRLFGTVSADKGAVSTEYALLLILIALAIVGSASAFGVALANKYHLVCKGIGGSAC